jgi:hypothetical protein
MPTLGCQASRSLTDYLLDGVRELAPASMFISWPLELALSHQQPDDFADEQRIALRLGLDGARDAVRKLAANDRVDEGCRVRDAQTSQAHSPRRLLARESREA